MFSWYIMMRPSSFYTNVCHLCFFVLHSDYHSCIKYTLIYVFFLYCFSAIRRAYEQCPLETSYEMTVKAKKNDRPTLELVTF